MRHIIFVSFLFCLGIQPSVAQDGVKVDPTHYKVQFENEKIRLLHINVGAGEEAKAHSHSGGVMVFLTDGQLKCKYRSGGSEVIHSKAGWTRWVDTGTFELMNAGPIPERQPFEAIFVESKKSTGYGYKVQPPFGAPDWQIEFENDRVRTLRINLLPNDVREANRYPEAVMIFLTDGHVSFYSNSRTEVYGKAGETRWMERRADHFVNLGDNTVSAIFVELKESGKNR